LFKNTKFSEQTAMAESEKKAAYCPLIVYDIEIVFGVWIMS
jgi:hypothetical protein